MNLTDIIKTPPHSVTKLELPRILRTLKKRHPYLPHGFFEKAEAAARGYINDATWNYKGMDAKELDAYVEDLKVLLPAKHHHILPEFRLELEKGIEGTYGNPMGI